MILRKASHSSLGGRLVAGEVSTALDDLAQLHVQALNRVCRVDHPGPDCQKCQRTD